MARPVTLPRRGKATAGPVSSACAILEVRGEKVFLNGEPIYPRYPPLGLAPQRIARRSSREKRSKPNSTR